MAGKVRPFGLLCVAAGFAAAAPSAALLACSTGVDRQVRLTGPAPYLLLGGLPPAFLGGLPARTDVFVGCLAALFFLVVPGIGAEPAGRATERTRTGTAPRRRSTSP
ncbi:hypothetical protein [Streptomyces sp. NRRL B-24484]|uniref:hypothetical protein n=1 Tax=Streptomyces sp. NRRL B-24484 TaxID=1463833 RepID=UPI0004BE76B0|nr:hypothetical protein [Streptomyces sp. NRRL B-24484]